MINQTHSSTKRVLVADDDPVVLDMVQVLAEREGFDVVTARDGREAYKVLHKDSDFQVVILDMVMPYLEGADLLDQMQTEKRLSRIPVIIMSASIDAKVESNSLAAGAAAFVAKPFVPDHLRRALRTVTRTGGSSNEPRLTSVETTSSNQPTKTIKVLLIEDNPGEAIVIESVLLKVATEIAQLSRVEVLRAEQLSQGIERLGIGDIDVVLLDLSLPDSEGLATLTTILRENAVVRVVVLTGMDDARIAIKAMESGAQNYLVKGEVDELGIIRAVRHAFAAKQETRMIKSRAA
jgi:CheY-like chemotaxis protein